MVSRALAAFAAVVLGPWLLVGAIATALLATPTTPHADAAPPAITRFVQVRHGLTSIAVGVDRTDRLRCISAVTGAAPAVVNVKIGASPLIIDRKVQPNTETGCMGLAAPRTGTVQLVPRDVWVYTRATAGGPVIRTRLP